MPIIAISDMRPLGTWTHQEIVSEAMILTGTLDSEDNVFLANVRSHMNMHIGHLVDMLNQQSSPYYGIYAEGVLEVDGDSGAGSPPPPIKSFAPRHPSGVEYIDNIHQCRKDVPDPNDPQQTVEVTETINWHSIKRVTLAASKEAEQADPSIANYGNLTNWDISRITQQSNHLNNQHKQTIAWCHHGTQLLVYTGKDIATLNRPILVNPLYSITDYRFVLWGYRQPIKDVISGTTIMPPAPAPGDPTPPTPSWFKNVDLPDKYVKLLIDMICKSIIQQRNGHVPNELDTSINSGLAMLSQNLQQAVALEQQSFNQRKTGQAQRAIGEL